MSGTNPLDRINFSNFNAFGLNGASNKFGTDSLSSPSIFPTTLPSGNTGELGGFFNNNYGDMFAQNLNQTAWTAILGVLANYKPMKLDLSSLGLNPESAPVSTDVDIEVADIADEIEGGNSSSVGSRNRDATQKFSGTAEDLNKILKGGVLEGKGAKFLELQEKYGISASVMVAIVCSESGYGKSKAAKELNNVAGIMTPESKCRQKKHFNSVDECLEEFASLLKRRYINQGLTTLAEIQKTYCPVGAANDPTGLNSNWLRVVASITDKIENMA